MSSIASIKLPTTDCYLCGVGKKICGDCRDRYHVSPQALEVQMVVEVKLVAETKEASPSAPEFPITCPNCGGLPLEESFEHNDLNKLFNFKCSQDSFFWSVVDLPPTEITFVNLRGYSKKWQWFGWQNGYKRGWKRIW